jgi:uncharacterized tellurite resistance protein B-like protein
MVLMLDSVFLQNNMGISQAHTGNRNKRRYLYHLIAVANADGNINEKELNYLRNKASELGLTPEVLDQLIQESNNISLPMSEGVAERMSYLEDCVKMATADGVIMDSEKAFCKKICNLLGLEEGYLEELYDNTLSDINQSNEQNGNE